jgi:23S rRNA (cytidine2498-2'-O)-methyltransferase
LRILFTAQAESAGLARRELERAWPQAHLEGWPSPEVGLLQVPLDWRTAMRRLQDVPSIFCRHICPALLCVPLHSDPDDLGALVEASRALLPELDRARSFSVQTRLLGEGAWQYGRFEVNEALAAAWQPAGGRLDVRQPAQVVSVNLSPSAAYLGLSWAADNLSNWAGGEQRFRREPGQISRAEFKLLEALDVLHLALPEGGLALDLGAAPGGWTRVALARGLHVVAVDPAQLHASLSLRPGLEYVNQTAQRFFERDRRRYVLLLNDMRMDALASAEVMLRAASQLQAPGLAVMTVKLPRQHIEQIVGRTLSLLTRRYVLLGARQLFHNRSEITVALRVRG